MCERNPYGAYHHHSRYLRTLKFPHGVTCKSPRWDGTRPRAERIRTYQIFISLFVTVSKRAKVHILHRWLPWNRRHHVPRSTGGCFHGRVRGYRSNAEDYAP